MHNMHFGTLHRMQEAFFPIPIMDKESIVVYETLLGFTLKDRNHKY